MVVKELTDLEKLLLEALKEARDHLEYCGYGDKWERECAQEAKLSQKIDAAVVAAEGDETWIAPPKPPRRAKRSSR